MRSAPSVTYPVGRSWFMGTLLLLLALLSLILLLYWLSLPDSQGQADRMTGLIWSVWLAWCVWAAWSWWHLPQGRLEWRCHDDGTGGWYWCPAKGGIGSRVLQTARPSVSADLQFAMLVRLPSRWLWLESRSDRARWAALRRALLAIRAS